MTDNYRAVLTALHRLGTANGVMLEMETGIAHGGIYTTLARMREAGYVEKDEARKLYMLTPNGRKSLREHQRGQPLPSAADVRGLFKQIPTEE